VLNKFDNHSNMESQCCEIGSPKNRPEHFIIFRYDPRQILDEALSK